MNKKIKMLIVVLALVLLLPFGVKAITGAEIQEKKEITINSVPPTNEDSFWQLNEKLYFSIGYQLKECNEGYTSCSVYKGTDEDEVVATKVTIKYEYDEDVKKVVDGIVSKIPESGKIFVIEDVYALSWLHDTVLHEMNEEATEGVNPIKYSPEFNNFIGFNNFFFEPRMGEDGLYASFQEGTFQFNYNGTTYGYGHLGTRVNYVVYVNDNETDIIGALKTRLSKYFKIKDITEDTEYPLEDQLNDELDAYGRDYSTCVDIKTLDSQIATLESEIEKLYNLPDEQKATEEWNNNVMAKQEELNNKRMQKNNMHFYGSCDMLDEYDTAEAYVAAMREELLDEDNPDSLWNMYSKALPHIYGIQFADTGDWVGIGVMVIKDSSKVIDTDLEVKTRDAKSGVMISNTGKMNVIPLDTLIQVSKLTSGDDYDKVVSALEKVVNKDNIDMFDLKLFSNAAANYITKLDDGTFEVRIPLSDKLKDKASLIAYYVDDNNEVKEYEVKIEVVDGVKYGVFTTDHFSVYTLAEKEVEEEPKFKVTYDFNGGTDKDKKAKVETEQVSVGLDISKANFIDEMGVTAPEGKELDAIEINGTRTELGKEYMLNKDTVFKYLWKDIPKEDSKAENTPDVPGNGDNEESPKTSDTVNKYFVLFTISFMVFACTLVYKYEYNK